MRKRTTLSALKQSFQHVLPASDGRTTLPPLDFVTGVVFCFLSDTKSFSLEAMRRFVIARFEVPISKGAFWGRLSGSCFKRQLYAVIGQLMQRFSAASWLDERFLKQLGVKGILLLDSSSISLWDGARQRYPGTRTTAAIKWHACFDLLSGGLHGFALSPGKTHDRLGFPPLETLVGKLIIFDLGYWDYGLLVMIDTVKGFFLSRVKTNAALVITQVIRGIGQVHVGSTLAALTGQRKRQLVVEFLTELATDQGVKTFRVIGFWNPMAKKYHWYITNLTVSAAVLYPLYILRWQLELVFKACKRSFNLDKRLTSNNDNIIESLLLSSLIASFAAHLVRHQGGLTLSPTQQLAISVQRAAYVVVQLAHEFINFITQPNKRFADTLQRKIKLFAPELVEKNHLHRPTSLQFLHEMLNA